MPLILTRHPAQSGDLEARLRQAGVQIRFMALTSQVLPVNTAELTTAAKQLSAGEFDWVLFTSGATVRALLAAGWSGEVPAHTQVGVVGPGTAGVLQSLTGIAEVWMPQVEHSAAGILEELNPPVHGGRLLLPQSAQARPLLVEGLRAQGWTVVHVQAYQTVSAEAGQAPQGRRSIYPAVDPSELMRPEDLGPGDVVLVTASSAAQELLPRLQQDGVRLLAIGEPTAATLAAAGRPADAVLRAPTADGVLAALN